MNRVIKFIQINIYKGKYLDELVDFLKKEDADIYTMQEVTAGSVNFCSDKSGNLFDLLREKLGLKGVFHSDCRFIDAPSALFGNALLTKWPILDSGVIPLNTFRPMSLAEFADPLIWSRISRHMLETTIQLGRWRLKAISVHGRRIAPPVDNDESTRQAKIIADHLASLGNAPFILGGDLNMPPGSEVVKTVCGAANNLMESFPIKQTLNPKVHELGENGYLVDYIFTSGHFKLKSLEVPKITVSDHLPVVAELEFETKN